MSRFDERGWLLRNPIVWIVFPIAVFALTTGFLEQPEGRWVVLLAALPLLLILFANLRIQVDERTIRLTYFPFWRRVIPLEQVESADVVPYKWWKYGGWGIRFGLDRSITYSVWEKHAVRIHLANGKRPVNIGTLRPQELLETIQKKRPAGPRSSN